MYVRSVVLGGLLLGVWGCDGASPLPCTVTPDTATERRADWIRRVHDEVFLPAHVALSAKAEALSTALSDYCGMPLAARDEAKLEPSRQAWRDLRDEVKKLDAIVIGPLVSERLHARLQFWPTRVARLESVIAAAPDGGYSPERLVELGTAVTGTAALEYLLFFADAPLWPANSGAEAALEARCEYVAALGRDLVASVAALRAAWDGGYSQALFDTGRGSETYECVQPAIDELVNAVATGLNHIYDTKMGRPLGTKTGGVVDLTAAESPYAEYGLPELIATVETFAVLWRGGGEDTRPTLESLVREKNPAIAQAVSDFLQEALTKLAAAAANGTMMAQLRGDTTALVAARVAMRDLYRAFAIEVGNVLGVRLTFSDVDGD